MYILYIFYVVDWFVYKIRKVQICKHSHCHLCHNHFPSTSFPIKHFVLVTRIWERILALFEVSYIRSNGGRQRVKRWHNWWNRINVLLNRFTLRGNPYRTGVSNDHRRYDVQLQKRWAFRQKRGDKCRSTCVVFYNTVLRNKELPEYDVPNCPANLQQYEIFPPGKIYNALWFRCLQDYLKDLSCRETISLIEGLFYSHVALAASTPYLRRVATTYATQRRGVSYAIS